MKENELRIGNWVLSPTEGEVQIENGWQIDEIEESYYNAYQLLIGSTDYDRLAEHGVFYLPENHEDPDVVLVLRNG